MSRACASEGARASLNGIPAKMISGAFATRNFRRTRSAFIARQAIAKQSAERELELAQLLGASVTKSYLLTRGVNKNLKPFGYRAPNTIIRKIQFKPSSSGFVQFASLADSCLQSIG